MTHITGLALVFNAPRIYFFGMDRERTANLLGALALALSDAMRTAVEDAAPEPGAAAAALSLIGHQPGISIERIRRAVGLSHPGTVRLVDRLSQAGLVERRPGLDDARAVALHLTAAGQIAFSAIRKARNGVLIAALDRLSIDDQRAIETLAERLLAILTDSCDRADGICRLCDEQRCDACPVDAELDRRSGGS